MDQHRSSDFEETYFAHEDAEKIRRLAFKHAAQAAEQDKEELRKLHYMHCPNCGWSLHRFKRGRVDVEMCFECKGIWLDETRLKALLADQKFGRQLVNSVLNIFKRKSLWGR